MRKQIITKWYGSFFIIFHNFDRLDIPIKDQGETRKDTLIGNDVWIGAQRRFNGSDW